MTSDKIKKGPIPKRNIVANIVITLGAIAIIGYAIILALLAYWGIADNPPEEVMVRTTSSLIIIFALCLIVQSVRQIMRLKYTNRYAQHLGAIYTIIASPAIGLIAATYTTYTLDPIMLLPSSIGVAGLVWWTVLLTKQNRIV